MATPAGSQSHPPHRPGPVCPRRPDEYRDDMNDEMDVERYACHIAQGDEGYQPLFQAIRIVQDKVYAAYLKFDKEAILNQKIYQAVSIFAVFFGAMSVFFAVTEVMRLRLPWDLFDAGDGELVTASLTIGFILIGLIGRFKEKWILARFKAESLRLVKFRRLTDPSMWCEPSDLDAAAADLAEEVEEIAGQNYDEAKEWAAKGVHPRSAAPPCSDRCPEALHELVDYYIPKRLEVQIRYLERHSDKAEGWGRRTAIIVQLLFWASFAFVLGHLAASHFGTETQPSVDEMMNRAKHSPGLDDKLALAALILPIAAAALRTYRAAHEYERTSLRHRATLESLHALSRKLRETKNLQEKFELIGFCELILEADCREFMRLVSEAEWYG